MQNTLKRQPENSYQAKHQQKKSTISKILLYFSLILGLALLVFAGLVAYRTFTTKLIIINPYSNNISVTVNNHTAKSIEALSSTKVRIWDKNYKIDVSGAVNDHAEIIIDNSLEQNLKNTKTVIYNPQMGGIVFLTEQDNTKALFGEFIEIDSSINTFIGEPQKDFFSNTSNIDVTFESSSGYLNLLKVNTSYNQSDSNLLLQYIDTTADQELLTDDNYAYVLAQMLQEDEKIDTIAKSLIQNDPSVKDYFMYQKLITHSASKEKLAKLLVEFQELQAKNPNNIDYLYLLGELEYSMNMGTDKLQQVIQKDPNYYYANATLTLNAFNNGDFTEAKKYFNKIEKQNVNDDAYDQIQQMILLASGEFDKLEELKGQTYCVDPNALACLDYSLFLEALSGKITTAKETLEAEFASETIDQAEYLQLKTKLAYYSGDPNNIPSEVIDEESEYFDVEAAYTYYFSTKNYDKAEAIRYKYFKQLLFQHTLTFAIYFVQQGDMDRAKAEMQVLADNQKNSSYGVTVQKIVNGEEISLHELNETLYSNPLKALLARYIYETDNSQTDFANYSKKMLYEGTSTEMMLNSL